MHLNILTWNTQLYECGNQVGNKRKEIDTELFEEVIDLIDKHLNKDNAIAVLQEIPFVSNVTWKEHELFKMFKEHYDTEKYTVIYNVFSKKQIKMTVVVSKKGLIDRVDNCEINNCYVPFKICGTDILALGVHAHNAFECHEYLKRNEQINYNMILGDFNAGNYLLKDAVRDKKIAINRRDYLLLTEGYIDIVQGQYTTKYETHIDHILLENSNDFILKHKYIGVDVNREIGLSDHYPIVFELVF